MKQTSPVFSLGIACLLAAGAVAGSSALGSVIDLGAASGFSVLATDGNLSSSDSAFQNGNIGVAAAGFSYTQSGGGQTNTQQPITAFINSGSTVGDHPTSVTVDQSHNAFLQQAVSDATHASNILGARAATDVLGNISTATTITKSAGNYVLSISNINLNQSALTLDAPAGSTFVINVSGSITLNGGSQGGGLRLAGGVTSNDVIYNIIGGGTVSTTGGGNAQDIQGTILDLGGSVQLHPGEVDGQIIAKDFTSSSGALVSPLNAVPEANAGMVLAPIVGLILLVSSRRMFGKTGDCTSVEGLSAA